jgi:hypothetical protein
VHRLIAKQIAKATGATGAVDIDHLAKLVDAAYEEFDQDRRRTDRSILLMIEEVDAVNRNLEQLVAKRTAELREREHDLQAQNVRFDVAINNMTQGFCCGIRRGGSSSAISVTFRCMAFRPML